MNNVYDKHQATVGLAMKSIKQRIGPKPDRLGQSHIKKIGLRVEEATDRARWREGVEAIAEGMRCIRPPSDTRKNRIKTGR